MIRGCAVIVMFCMSLWACNLGTVSSHTPNTEDEDKPAACPPLRYAENPTEAVSALPVQIGNIIYSESSVFGEDNFAKGTTEKIDGLAYTSLFSCPNYFKQTMDLLQCNGLLFVQETSKKQMYYEKDGQAYYFQTFQRFRFNLEEYSLPDSFSVNGRIWLDVPIAVMPASIPYRPWFLLIQDRNCPSRAEFVANGLIRNFEFVDSTTEPVFVMQEEATHPTVGNVTITWPVIRAPVDAWFYFGFVTQASELIMSSGENSRGKYLALEKHHYGSGLTVVESCGQVYNPRITDFVDFEFATTDTNQDQNRGKNQPPLSDVTVDSLAYWWNRRRGGLPIDSTPFVIPESLADPLEPWYSVTVHIGSCMRRLEYYVPECLINYHFQSSSQRSCDGYYYLKGMPQYRLLLGDRGDHHPENVWFSVLRP